MIAHTLDSSFHHFPQTMRLPLTKIVCAAAALALSSCEKQEAQQPEFIGRKVARQLQYVYKGEEIKLHYVAQGDSFSVVKDANAKKLEHIFLSPKQTSFVNCATPKTVYLYDSYQDFELDKGKGVPSVTQSKSAVDASKQAGAKLSTVVVTCGTIPPAGYLYNRVSLFADDNFGGDENLVNYTSTDPNNRCYVRVFASTLGDWNDKISSFILNADFPPGQAQELAIRLTMWTSEYYDGSSLIFQTNPGTVGNVAHMSDYTYGSFFSRRSWNDEPSSLQLNIFSYVN